MRARIYRGAIVKEGMVEMGGATAILPSLDKQRGRQFSHHVAPLRLFGRRDCLGRV